MKLLSLLTAALLSTCAQTPLFAQYVPRPGGSPVSASSVAYAATVTPNVGSSGQIIVLTVGTLTGNITLANPTGTAADGQVLKFRFKQDATGSRTLTWGTNFAFGTDTATSTIPTAANATWIMAFEYDSTSSKFRAVGISRGF